MTPADIAAGRERAATLYPIRYVEVWSNGLLYWRSEPFTGDMSPPLPYDLASDYPFEARCIEGVAP